MNVMVMHRRMRRIQHVCSEIDTILHQLLWHAVKDGEDLEVDEKTRVMLSDRLETIKNTAESMQADP